MAIINKKGFVSGLVGNVVFRESDGSQIVQTRPPGGKQAKRKQTKKTRLSGKEFGLASSAGSEIRNFMRPVYFDGDSRADSRLTGVIRSAIRASSVAAAGQRDLHDADLKLLEGYEFNLNSPLLPVLPELPAIHFERSGLFEIAVPALDGDRIYRYPKRTLISDPEVVMNIAIFAFNYRHGLSQLVEAYTLLLERGRNKEQLLTCKRRLPEGSIVLTLVSLHYYRSVGYNKKQIVNNRSFSPSAIINAFHLPSDYLSGKEPSLILEHPLLQPSKMYRYKGNEILEQIRGRSQDSE